MLLEMILVYQHSLEITKLSKVQARCRHPFGQPVHQKPDLHPAQRSNWLVESGLVLGESSSWEYRDVLIERGQKEGQPLVVLSEHLWPQWHHAALSFSLLRSNGNVYPELLQLPILFRCMNLSCPLQAFP